MPRKVLLQSGGRALIALIEAPAQNESQLQELVKDNPDLLPVEEFGMSVPLLVVGRETVLPPGWTRYRVGAR